MKRIMSLLLVLLCLSILETSCSEKNKTFWESNTRDKLEKMAADLTVNLKPWSVPDRVFLVEDYGAKPDSVTLNTIPIQNAVDDCSAKGGGVVRFSKGKYVTGTIVLKSNVMIELGEGVKIIGSTSLKDYPHISPKVKTGMDTREKLTMSIFYAEGVENIGIRGNGTIDGSGNTDNFKIEERLKNRPFVIRMYDSNNILIEDVHLTNSPSWMQLYMNCENLILQRVKVTDFSMRNNDGIDIDGCRRVLISRCEISSHDDAICLKGNSRNPLEDILIENCKAFTHWNAFKVGTDTQGDFRRVMVRNCTLGGIADDPKSKYCSSGITIASVDGGTVEDFWFYNNTINNARCPVYIVRNNRGRVMEGLPKPEIGIVRRVIIENTKGDGNINGGAISGIPGFPVENVLISNFNIGIKGSTSWAKTLQIFTQGEKRLESYTTYPDAVFLTAKKFYVGIDDVPPLPAKGFSLRDAKGIVFNGVTIKPKIEDNRPLFYQSKNVEADGISQK